MKKKDSKSQGIFETIRQVNEQERRRIDEKNEKELIRHEKQRNEYGKTLEEDKKKLLKLKQGMISRENAVGSDIEEKKKYTIWQKFKNFIYHNKWWLGFASFFAIVAGFLIYDKLTATKPDLSFMLLSDNIDINAQYEDIGKYFDSIIKDYNDDGEKYANILCIPISADEDVNSSGGLYESNLARLNAEFQLGQTMIVIADKNSDSLIVPEENLADLEKRYPDNGNIKKYGFYLKNTKFAELVGFKGELPEDLYIGVRKITDTLSSEKETKRNYDIAMETLDKLIKELTK